MSLATLIAFAVLGQTDSLPSGPPVGEPVKEFKVLAYSGPNAGKEFEVTKDAGKKPTLLVFINKMSRPALQFLKPIDDVAAQHEGLATQIIWLTEDKDKTLDFLKRAENSMNLRSPLAVGLDGTAGPPNLGLNDMVAVTVLVSRDGKVIANVALVDPNGKDSAKVTEALKKVLAK